jgi:hypothetical protein
MQCANCQTLATDPELFCLAFALCHDCMQAKSRPTDEDWERADRIHVESYGRDPRLPSKNVSRGMQIHEILCRWNQAGKDE